MTGADLIPASVLKPRELRGECRGRDPSLGIRCPHTNASFAPQVECKDSLGEDILSVPPRHHSAAG